MKVEPAYDCRREQLGRLADRFVPLSPDAENHAWLKAHGSRPHGRVRLAAVGMLSSFMSLYDAHGLTGSYPMHLLSTAQLRQLIGDGLPRLLDVGAGAGYVTAYAEPLAAHITCTETSRRLSARLRRRGYEVLERDLGAQPLEGAAFDAVLCLNVLDRTSHPLRLLRGLRALCAPHARLLVAVPVPLAPAVFVPGASVDPAEPLPRRGRSFESAAVELSEQLFEPLGLEVVRLARAPYYSVGDAHQPLYALDDALFVLRRAG